MPSRISQLGVDDLARVHNGEKAGGYNGMREEKAGADYVIIPFQQPAMTKNILSLIR